MKRFILFVNALVLILSANRLTAQQIMWNSAPKTGFVFQITNKEAEKLLTRSRPDTIIYSMLHTQIDTFNVDKGWTHRPDKGHFILARIIENKLHCEYTSVFPYQVLLLKEYNALALQVVDLEGNVRDDARVKFRTRRIRFDPESNTYRLENDWFNRSSKIVTVELDGFRSVFNVEKHEVPQWANNWYEDDEGPDFYSYMITDKNKYKPGERVRFKSYALSGSRNPIRRDLEVWLIRTGKPIKVGTVSPHRPGSFAGEVQLHDSLKLTLDTYYTLQLREKNGRVVSNCNFKYEDYELHGNKLQIALDTPRHFHPASNYVHINATSENGLRLKDARASVVVLTDNIREIFQPLVVLRDTLMFKELQLDPDGETVVEIPSSLFQKSNTRYYVHVSVVNSENQRMEETVAGFHDYSRYELTATFSHDSIVYQALNNGIPMQRLPVKVFRDRSTEWEYAVLPFREKINPAMTSIRFQSDLVSRTFSMADFLPKIELVGGIAKDSFNVSVNNPQKIQLSWYIYQGSDLLEKGAGTELEFKSAIEDRSRTYYAEVLYSFGGQDHIVRQEFPFREGALNVTLNMPDRVYPGQEVEASIDVADDAGNPVGGVDLTALATTAKLNYFLPDLLYYGSTSDPRSQRATYSKRDVNKRTATLNLDYDKWKTRARLDTMKYYQFAYPGDKMFTHQVEIDDSTQFAIYVMKEGAARPVYVVEVNRKPVYYSWTNQPHAYSFYVKPERMVEVTLRLYDRVLILDSLRFDKGKKTILSLDLDRLPQHVGVHKIAPEMVKVWRRRKRQKWVFTGTEKNRIRGYLAVFAGTAHPSYLVSREGFVPVSAGDNKGSKLVVGPVFPGMQTFVEQGRVQTTYRHEGGFSYSFEDNIVYKMEPPSKTLLPDELRDVSFSPVSSLNDLVINKKLLLEREAVDRAKWHPRVIDLVDHACRVKVLLPEEEAKSGVASVLFQNCKTNAVISPCRDFANKSDYFTVPRGLHHIIVLYNNGAYLKMDSVDLQSYTSVVADMTRTPLHGGDSTSVSWSHVASDCFGSVTTPARAFDFVTSRSTTGNVQGVILDETNMPLPGATVVVKGTVIGAVTDINGRFYIDVPADPSTLVVSFIGFMTKEIEVRPGSQISVVMEPEVMALQEVVVVAYGTVEKREMTGAIAIRGALSGRVAGVAIAHEEEAEDVDRAQRLPKDEQRQAEQELYRELMTLQSMRSHFSDVAFWEPRLFTDRHGKSAFTVTFPDDITRWDAVVYAMNRRLQTGTGRKQIKSYKPLMAELHVPQFLTAGDSADFLGKVLNYTSDETIRGKTAWTGSDPVENGITFDSYYAEKHRVVAASSDTIKTSYAFMRDDGYFDGEERIVPVVEQGTIRANGTLATLHNNDALHLQAGKGEVVKVEIFDNQLDLYAADVRFLLHYKYDCNEQLASKLIGLLNNKLLMQYQEKPFKHDKDVDKIIRRLMKNQNEEFLWSWWDVSPNTSYWMSAHILRALKAAKDAGYAVNLDVDNLVRKATYKYDFLHDLSISDAQLVHALALWGANIDYARYVDKLDRKIQISDSIARQREIQYPNSRYSRLHEKLLLLEVRQLRGLPFVRDSLLRYKQQTILNEVYFSDGLRERYWYTSDLPNNAIAYRIVARDSALSALKVPMQMHFLSLRKKRRWNTYEASNVLMSILPDLIAAGASEKVPAVISLGGKLNRTIPEFPFTAELRDGEELDIRKDAGMPLYCMQYVEERVTTARSGTDAFKVKTAFNENVLKAGKPTILKATVEVKREAKLEHVMIEIPIPGGCSYGDKRQVGNRIETHREYFKDRTVIFCENMTAGTYVFQIQLLPRFTGKYHVNPAQVSLMYFPVVNVNNDMQLVKIAE